MEDARRSKAVDAQAKMLSPDIEIKPSRNAVRYTKMTGFANIHVRDYEATLVALLFLRGQNSGHDFQLAASVQDTCARDFVLFRFKSREEAAAWTTVFVHSKHSERNPLSRNQLTNPNGDFSLSKCFKLCLETKQAMSTGSSAVLFDGDFKDCQFVIFTNATAGDELVGGRSGDFSQAETFLWSGVGSVFSFERDKDMLDCLGGCGNEGDEFLNRLRVFCGQPSAADLKAAVEDELVKLCPDINIERLCEWFLNNVKVWWETSNEILHSAHIILQRTLYEVRQESKLATAEVRLQTLSTQTLKDYVLPLEFAGAARLKFDEGLTLVESSESSGRLTLTKVVQSSEGQSLLLSAQQLAANRPALLAECKNYEVKRLIVIIKDWRSVQRDVISEMCKTLQDTVSIVIESDGNNSLTSELSEMFPGRFESVKDSFEMSQLKPGSIDILLNKVVNLQGHEITLGTLLGNNSECLDQVLDASLLVDILERVGPLTVGSALPDGIDYFVERTLEQPCVRASAFRALEGTVTVRITQSGASGTKLFDTALEFVNSLEDFPSFDNGEKEDVLNELVQSLFDPDRKDCEAFIGPKFLLRSYECNCVGLRCGQENAVTALRVCPSKEALYQVGFLFVSDAVNEDDVTRLTESHQSRNVLTILLDGRRGWVESCEDIESIREHIDPDQVSRFAFKTVMDVVGDRLILVCAEPGMGKSTLMVRLAKNTKAAFPHYFVVLVALNDHSELFAEDKHADVLGFLSVAAKMDSSLERSLLKFALEVSGNVIIIVDGFDEIAPTYIEQSYDLLSSLLEKTKARKVWMTSRNSVKHILEKRFSKFSTKLCEFVKEEQKNFLIKLWGGKSIDEELNEFVDHLIDKFPLADRESNFLGIPLHTWMLAEVYEEQVTESAETIELPDKLDLLSLVEKFLERRFSHYVQQFKIEGHGSNEETFPPMSRQDFFASHASAAIVLILGTANIQSLRLDWVLTEPLTFCNAIKQGAYKTGFIVEIVNDKPRFIHRVFAEYFVANWISQHFADNLGFFQSKMFTPDFNVIRYFFNGILCKGKALHAAVLQENVEQVKTLLEREDMDVEAQDVGGRTALHLAASLGASEDQEEDRRRCEILDLIIGKTSDFKVVDKVLCGSPMRYADIARWWTAIDKLLCQTVDDGQLTLTLENMEDEQMLSSIFKLDLEKLLGFCLDNGLAVEEWYLDGDGEMLRLLVRACTEGSVKAASLLVERNADINVTESDRCFRKDGPLIAASSRGHLEIVKSLVEKYVSTSSRHEDFNGETDQPDASEYINEEDRDGNTAIHWAALGGHADVITFLLSRCPDKARAVLSRDLESSTPLHLAAKSNKPNTLRVLFEALSETDRVAADCSDDCGHGVLHIAATHGSVACVEFLVAAGWTLLRGDCDGKTSLMTAAGEGKHEVVECMLNNFDAVRENLAVVDFINLKDKYDRTVMHHAASGGFVKCIEILAEAGATLSQMNFHRETPLMTAAAEGNGEVVKCLLKNFNHEKEGITLVDFVRMNDSDGKTVMHYAARGGSVECVELLVEAGGTLSRVNCDGETPLMAAARESRRYRSNDFQRSARARQMQRVVKCLLDEFSEERDGVSLEDFISMKDMHGRTALDKASAECREAIENYPK